MVAIGNLLHGWFNISLPKCLCHCVFLLSFSQCTLSDATGETLSLLFAGQECGHISLLHGAGLTMTAPTPAHAGHVIKLSSTANHIPLSPSSSPRPPALVSYGSDERLNVWGLEIEGSPSSVVLKLLMTVTMDTCPPHMEILQSTLCLALENNRLVSLVVSADSPRHSGTVQRLSEVPGLLTHQLEDDHTDAITSLTSCPFLGLFVTTSRDGRAKIWNSSNQLVSELNLGSSLSSACFATAQGDLLVGFQEHISVVRAGDFLPGVYLEAAGRRGQCDHFEEPIPFDSDLKFWYV